MEIENKHEKRKRQLLSKFKIIKVRGMSGWLALYARFSVSLLFLLVQLSSH